MNYKLVTKTILVLALFGFLFVFRGFASAQPALPTLHEAAVHRPEKIDTIIANGGSPDALDAAGRTPLQEAVSHRIILGVAKLLASGADPNVGNKAGNSLLGEAATTGNLQNVRLLLAFGADSDSEFQQRTALHTAIVHNYADIVDMLLKQGRGDLNKQGSGSGWTALHWAVQHERKDIIAKLLARRADISVRDHAGNTAHDLAVLKTDKTIAQLLDAPK
jgi:ankyrin repeat protein